MKGGVLMAAYSKRRPTRDIDLSAFGFFDGIEACVNRIRSIVAIELELRPLASVLDDMATILKRCDVWWQEDARRPGGGIGGGNLPAT